MIDNLFRGLFDTDMTVVITPGGVSHLPGRFPWASA